MSKISDTIFEERDEMMISPNGDSIPTLRTAHFLKPTINVVDHHHQSVQSVAPCFLSANPSSASAHDIKNLRKKVNFHPSQYVDNNAWTCWVERLRSKHKATWKKAGIYEAIVSSTYRVPKQNEVIFGVAEKWCPETNTFVFPWGEATISLEDMIVLGGFSVLGDSPLLNLSCCTDDKESEKYLVKACSDIIRLTAQVPRLKLWLYYFDNKNGCEKIEHEAFLCCWLSRYVFTYKSELIAKHLFPLAIHLARGTRIALAPAVLAYIYKNLSALKTRMVHDDEALLTLYAPFHLVLVWIWERFPSIRPTPNLIQCDTKPRLARWNNVKKKQVEDVKLSVESEGEDFQWRPYAASSTFEIWPLIEFKGDYEEWVSLLYSSNLAIELESLIRCIRVSELVGLGCTEQYLPHRVAMQLGFDQDIPPNWVSRSSSETIEIAWRDYIRPIGDTKLYIPPKLFESDVTMRYFAWWRGPAWVPHGAVLGVGKEQENLTSVSHDAVLGVGVEHENLMEPTLVAEQQNELQSLVIEDNCGYVEIEVMNINVEEKKRADNPTIDVLAEQQNEVENLVISEDKCRNMTIEVMSNVEERKGANHKTDIFVAVTGSQDSEEDCIDSTVETPGLELELRIVKLEEVFAKLKEAQNHGKARNS